VGHLPVRVACDTARLIQALIGYWGDAGNRGLLSIGPKRVCDQTGPAGGLSVWIASRWYPALLLLYSGGIAAVAARKYENLKTLLLAPVSYTFEPATVEPTLMHAAAEAMRELHSAFGALPGQNKRHTPLSDYLHTLFGPLLEDLLFLGSEYETAFDQFEILNALEHGHRYGSESGTFRYWGPVGRFEWKRKPRVQPGPPCRQDYLVDPLSVSRRSLLAIERC
jgi:hypothetical protein